MKEYYPHLDLLKGIAILLMVMGHGIAWSYPDWHFLTSNWQSMSIEHFNASFIWKVIYSFHMPLLFFVSGYLFYRNDILTISKVLSILNKRIQRLLIPYITTGFFVLLLKDYFGYWFFIVLFVLNNIVLAELYFEDKFGIRNVGETFCHFVIFVALFLSAKIYKQYLPNELINLANLSQYYLLFMFGYLLHKYNKFEDFILRKQISFLSLVFYIVLMVVVLYFDKINILGLFIPLCASSFLYYFTKNENDSVCLRGIRIVGQYSMEIYVFHLFFVIQIPEIGQYILTLTNFSTSITLQLVYSLIIAVIAVFFSINMAKIINSNQYLSKLLFGKG